MLFHALPRPVRLILAGTPYRVHQLRLRDVAYLEEWCRGGPGADWAPLLLAESVADPDERHAALKTAFDAAEAETDMAAVNSPGGFVITLWLALRRGQRFTRQDAVSLAGKLSEHEWRALQRIAWWLDPLDECAAAIDREIGALWAPDAPKKGDWTEAVAAVAVATGWSFATIGRLTLSQWDTIRRHISAPEAKQERGHPIATPEAPPQGWSLERFASEVADKRAKFWANGSAATGSGETSQDNLDILPREYEPESTGLANPSLDPDHSG